MRARWNMARPLATLGAILVVLIAPACAAQGASPAAFVQQTYDRYTRNATEADTLQAEAPKLFAAALLKLIREDQRQAQGEVGLLDHDPLCACQDFAGFELKGIDVTPVGKDQAKASVRFVNGGQPVQIGLTLVQEARQWRISDVQEPEMPSLRKFLEEGLAKASAPKSAP
jgi:hypothetical protein